MSFPLTDMTTRSSGLTWTGTTSIGAETAGGNTSARKTAENGTELCNSPARRGFGPARSGDLGSWLVRRVDPWGPLFALAGTVIFLLHGFGGTLTRDLALYAYSGQQFAEGEPPYVSVLNRAGPLAHIVPGIGAAFARVVGTDALLTQRAL